MVKVSVIVPNYNHEKFLQQRIDSILEQTYQNFELIILDDCSTDDSRAVIETYRKHPNVSHIIYNEENSGTPFFQWQKGVTLAKGEFIWIAESDDFAEPQFLEKTLLQIENNKQIGLVYTDSNIIQNGVKIDNFKNRNFRYLKDVNWGKDHLVEGTKELEQHLLENCTIYNVSAVLFKKEALKSVIGDIINFKFAGDWACYMLIALDYDIYYISTPLNNYRTHDNNLTKKSGANYLAMFDRIKARHFIIKKLEVASTLLSKKAKRINYIELKAVTGGLLRSKVSLFAFLKILKYYI